MSLHFHPLRVRSIRPETDEAVVVAFDVPHELEDTFRFSHGQHLTLRNTIDGSDERRSYSICAGTGDGELRVGVRKVPGGRFSTWINDTLRAGDTVQVMAPEGRFFVPLEPAAARHYLGIAGGSGITPILSIMKTVLAAEPLSRFTLIYGNRKLRSTMFTEELEDLKNRYLSRLTMHMVFSQESTDLPLHNGRLDRAKIGDFLGKLVDVSRLDHVFVCGPHGVNDEAEAALLDAGLAPERIHVERFGVPDADGAARREAIPPRAGEAPDAIVTIIRDRPAQRDRVPRLARQRARRGGCGRSRGAVLLQVGRLLHLSGQAARRRGAHGSQLRPREARGRRGFHPDVPGPAADRPRRDLVRRPVGPTRCRADAPQATTGNAGRSSRVRRASSPARATRRRP